MNLKKRIKNVVAQGKSVDSAKIAESSDNSVLGMQFRTCKNFQASTDTSLVESPKISTNTKATPQSLPLRFCESQNLSENNAKSAESSLNSAPSTNEANSAIVDEFLGLCEASDKDRTQVHRGSELKQSLKSRCESKFAPKVGIVIPIYNVAPYLNECLDSVANQTYKNFYAVLVNDGSTDESRQIALDYVAKDSRFILIDKENGGLSSARNVGINYFKSFAESSKNTAESSVDSANIHTHKNAILNSQIDYIIFLDSDDFWEKDLLKECVRVAESSADSAPSTQGVNSSIVDEFLQLHEASDTDRTLSPSRKRGECDCEKSPQDAEFTTPPRFAITNPSIIWFGFKTFGAKARTGDPLDLFAFKDIATISPREWVWRAQQAGIGQFWFSWGGMMDFRFLCEKKLQFLEGALYEDELFGVQVFAQSRAICVLPKKLYNYRIRESSLASSARRKSLPPSLAHLRRHFSDENIAWQYFCASSFARILVESVAFFERLDDKALARALKRAFLPTLFARSCDILGFRHDPYLMKSRVVELLKANGRYFSALNLLAKIPHKRTRYTIFLSYFAPRLVWGRIKRRIKLLFGAGNSVLGMQFRTCENFGESTDSSLVLSPKFSQIQKPHRNHFRCDSAQGAESRLDFVNPQNLGEKSNKKNFSKVFASFCFCKKKNLPNPLNSNSSSDLDSANQAKIAESALDSAKSGDLRG